MIYRVLITRTADEDIERLKKSGDKTSVKRLETILVELTQHPETGYGSPERLKYGMAGYWSRRISAKHRIIYSIDDETICVIVVAAYGHYLDK